MTWQTWTRPALAACALTLTLGTLPAAASEAPTTQADYGAVETIIRERAAAHGQSGERLILLARCESSMNRWAVGRAGELGPFQLLPGGELQGFYARGYSDPHDWYEASDYTALRFAEGAARAWSCAR